MQTLIVDENGLSDVLKTHTKSSVIPSSLLQWFNGRMYRAHTSIEYRAYSRGPSTVILKFENSNVYFIEAIPKIVKKAWYDGIDANLLAKILHLIKPGDRIRTAWNSSLSIQFNRGLSEPEVLFLLKEGFVAYSYEPSHPHETYVMMR